MFPGRLQLSVLFCFLDVGASLGFRGRNVADCSRLHSPRFPRGKCAHFSCGLKILGSPPRYLTHAQVSGGWRWPGLSLRPPEAGRVCRGTS